MELELIVSIVMCVILLAGAFLGWKNGGASVLRYALVTLFAVLVSLRFGHLAFTFVSRVLPGVPPGYLAAGVYLALFVIGGGVAGAVVNLKAPGFQTVYTNLADKIIGVLLGLFSASLISGTLLISSALILPSAGQVYNESKLLVRLDQWPPALYRVLESKVAGISAGSASQTPLPTWQQGSGGDSGTVIWR